MGHRNDLPRIRQRLCKPTGGSRTTWSTRVRTESEEASGVQTNATHRAGFFPGAIYLCSYWYMPKELATRIALFYVTSALSGAFSGLLAAGIAQMNGVGHYSGWRWIFIVEGLATILLGVMCFFCLIDSPKLSHRWLSPDEIRYLELELFIKQGGRFSEAEKDKPHWSDLRAIVPNWRMYCQAYILCCCTSCSYGKVSLSSRDLDKLSHYDCSAWRTFCGWLC